MSMNKNLVLLSCFVLASCASAYKNPQSKNTADIEIVLKEPLKLYTAVSVFDGIECSASPNGEYVGSLGKEVKTEKLNFKVDAGKVVSFELFERFEFTAEVVYPGQYCKNLLAFTPEKGGSYLIEYFPNCEYTFVNTKTNKKVKTQKPTGKCHSGYLLGAYD